MAATAETCVRMHLTSFYDGLTETRGGGVRGIDSVTLLFSSTLSPFHSPGRLSETLLQVRLSSLS